MNHHAMMPSSTAVAPSQNALLIHGGTAGFKPAWHAIKIPARIGMVVIAMFTAFFGGWASFAPLDGGAIAPGVVSPHTNRKTVQHLEGGIIAKLDVRDGDVVQEGQTLLILEDVQSKAIFQSIQQERRALTVTRARLEAEKSNLAEPQFPDWILTEKDIETLLLVQDQAHLFKTRLEMHQARLNVLHLRTAQIKEQVKGYMAQVSSADRQLALIADEVKGKAHLLARNLITKPEVLKLERAEAEISGRRGEALAGIARAMEQVGEIELQRLAAEKERSDQVANQLDEVRRRLAETEQKLEASRDVLRRTVIRAPTDGVVLNMKFKTIGGVVNKGEPILDIVPVNDGLVIEARINPVDIDVVRPGLPALVYFTAYSSRSTQKVTGVIKLVSADRIIDEFTKLPYFSARVDVAKKELENFSPQFELLPGMSAEVMIVTERRTLLHYLLQPFLDAWRRSFREA